MSVERTAAKYLENFLKQQVEIVPPVRIEPEQTEFEDAFAATDNVIVQRAYSPRFFAGVLGRSARPVWSDDHKQAKLVSLDRVDLYEQRLGEVLIPSWPL